MDAAVYFDGQSSRRHVVALTFGDQLDIADAGAGGEVLASWPYDAVRRVDGPEDALRLACNSASPLARLELRDPRLRADILRLCPSLDGAGSVATVSAWRIAIASLAAAAAIIGMIWFGMPLFADRLATVIPYSWEGALGEAVDPRLRALLGEECERGDGVAALHQLVERLQSAAHLPVAPHPVVLRAPTANAFALPGGRVYLLSGLIAKSETVDELAGVVAHELGHLAHRDGLRRLLREGGTGFLLGLMFGDVTGAGAVLFAARAVLAAAHTRAAESEADTFAVSTMHALGRPTAPMAALLQRLAGPGEDTIPSLLRDHPLTPERKAMLAADDVAPTGPTLLDGTGWLALKRICDR